MPIFPGNTQDYTSPLLDPQHQAAKQASQHSPADPRPLGGGLKRRLLDFMDGMEASGIARADSFCVAIPVEAWSFGLIESVYVYLSSFNPPDVCSQTSSCPFSRHTHRHLSAAWQTLDSACGGQPAAPSQWPWMRCSYTEQLGSARGPGVQPVSCHPCSGAPCTTADSVCEAVRAAL